MNQGGTNGTVTAIAGAGTNSCSATVSFPGDATVQPPILPYTEDYTSLDAAEFDVLLAAFEGATQTPPIKVDVTVNGTGDCTGVTAHR